MADRPASECPACGKPLQRRRTLLGVQYVCRNSECRESPDVAARWMASELKPPSG
jgi:ssDNA-binding Zn-finger/Zn-ribbon topoisomerase 1